MKNEVKIKIKGINHRLLGVFHGVTQSLFSGSFYKKIKFGSPLKNNSAIHCVNHI